MARWTAISGAGVGWALGLLAVLLPMGAQAEEARGLHLAAPQELVATGLLDYILPRFSLKTQVPVTVVTGGLEASAAAGATAEVALGAEGTAVFSDAARTWHLAVLAPEHPGAQRFAQWLGSEVGLRTVLAFAPEGAPLFQRPAEAVAQAAAAVSEGDAGLGHDLSLRLCGRCHVVSEANRMKAIGSTPSFPALRGFADWEERFSAFYVLKPHGAFTRIAEVTEPFPAERPSPIVPLDISLEQLDSILAYVAGLAPADLGQPLQVK